MRQSAITDYAHCPHHYKLRYLDKLETIKNQDANNALYLGTAIHYGCETGSSKQMLDKYYSNYYAINDKNINEAIKIEYLLPKVLNFINQYEVLEHEVNFKWGSFTGTADLLAHNKDGTVDLYDYKYSNNVDNYMNSPQLHLYKYFLELQGYKVRKMAFIFIPKTFIKQKQTEDLYMFRKRLDEALSTMEIKVMYLPYDADKVAQALNIAITMLETKVFNKTVSKDCKFCEYEKFCNNKEIDYMNLPKVERVEINAISYMKGWIYGAPFCGKTTFLDNSPVPLNLNTDGNVKYVTMQRIALKDSVTVQGRTTTRKYAWEVLKEAIDELEKGSEFKTIIVDLVEDTREMCRIFMYHKLNITHESDSGYGKGWDIIKTEYLSTMRRLLNIDSNIFLVSHEDISKDFTKSGGDKISKIMPNMQEAIANSLAGMVDFVARVIVNENDTRVLSFKQNEVTFGGGRLGIKEKQIPLDWKELMNIYKEAKTLAIAKSQHTPIVKKTTESVITPEEKKEPEKATEKPIEKHERNSRTKVEPATPTEIIEEKQPVEEKQIIEEKQPEKTETDHAEDKPLTIKEEAKPRTRRKRVQKTTEGTPIIDGDIPF